MEGDPGIDRQYSNPSGIEGSQVLGMMNEHHAPLWDWCLSRMPRSVDGSVLDIGCGGGGFIKRMSEKYPSATFFGADISRAALDATLDINRGLHDSGRLELVERPASDLGYGDGTFDLVTAQETYFFWPDPEEAFGEVARVIAPGGLFVIGSEMQFLDEAGREEARTRYRAEVLPDAEVVELLENAGFHVDVAEEGGKWTMFSARRLRASTLNRCRREG